MNLLLIHQNFPGQFKLLGRELAQREGWTVVGIGDGDRSADLTGNVRYHPYHRPTGVPGRAFPPIQTLGEQVRRGRSTADVVDRIANNGFEPDAILVHPGWGDAMFLRDVFPQARMISYLEYYYRSTASDLDFDHEFVAADADRPFVRLRNTANLLAFAESDTVVTPTQWQASTFPGPIRRRLEIVHDGIDTARMAPDPNAAFATPNGRVLSRADEVVTYISRSLEPYRGFHRVMRALPGLLRRRPNAEIVIVGGDDVSYGTPPPGGGSWKQRLLDEVGGKIDRERVHFLGRVPYSAYRSLLQVSTAHLYLTYPFVLSWSLIEAMAAGCAIVGSSTGPVLEVIEHERTGLTVDFFDQDALIDAIERLLEDASLRQRVGAAARRLAVERYDFRTCSLPRYLDLLGAA